MPIDSDYAWLKSHLAYSGDIKARSALAAEVAQQLVDRIKKKQLPYTLGIFGGWGTGKTTFSALLASELEACELCKVVYFNSWKYAGFMETVPALIFKILQYGMEGDRRQQDEAALRVLLALGKKYADQVGDWAKSKIGINPTELFKNVYEVARKVQSGESQANPEVIRAYYTQVDKAQDSLRDALGTVDVLGERGKAVVVLIDELDRCDPDEAFSVIKQMRVLFGMRDLPIAFVVCANPEPIGLAIKHRYGLESDTGDYEARRILEKFVDSYQDLGTVVSLGALVTDLWREAELPWLIRADAANQNPRFGDDTVLNATALDVFTTAIAQFGNLRVLKKSFEYVEATIRVNRHFLWTHWLLEICEQVDPRLRRELGLLAQPLQKCVEQAYRGLQSTSCEVAPSKGRCRAVLQSDKGHTLFAILRSYLWEVTFSESSRLKGSEDPEDLARHGLLAALLSDPRKMNFVALLGLLPFHGPEDYPPAAREGSFQPLNFGAELGALSVQFGYVLSN